MVFKNVVVAYDGSDHALAAVTKAAELVKDDAGAKLHLVFVTTHPNAQLPANFNSASFDPQQYLLSVEDIMNLYNKTIEEETERSVRVLALCWMIWAIALQSRLSQAILLRQIFCHMLKRSMLI